MKKIIFLSLTTLLIACVIDSYAQNSNTTAKLNRNSSSKDLTSQLEPPDTNLVRPAKPVSIFQVNTKAVRNFIKDFKEVIGVQWIETSNGLFAAYFNNDHIQSLVCYNNKGNFECMLRYYKEEKLPREIRGLVKSSYYDFNIYLVTEVHRNDKIAYVIKMEDKTSWKTVKVVDGEMEVTEDYKKSK